jgi:hypothetical protein
VFTFLKKAAAVLIAAAVGDLVALNNKDAVRLPDWESSKRPVYAATMAASTAALVYRNNRALRLVLWPVLGFITWPRIMDAMDGPGTSDDRLNSEHFGAKSGFVLAVVVGLWPWVRRMKAH